MASTTILTTEREQIGFSLHGGSYIQHKVVSLLTPSSGKRGKALSNSSTRIMFSRRSHGRALSSNSSMTIPSINREQYDIEEVPVARGASPRRPLVMLVTNITLWIGWSIYFTRQCQLLRMATATGSLTLVLGLFLIAETLLASQDLILALNVIYPLLTKFKSINKPRQLLKGGKVPSVDICITCCSEPFEVIMNTVRAAATLDYPTDRYRIMVLDDGKDDNLRKAVESISASNGSLDGPQIFYRSREVPSNARSYYKSGNLRFGIAELASLGRSEFLANLDCDMIPHPQWLRIMLPTLLQNDRVALVNPPQNYYNVPQCDPLGQQTNLDVSLSVYEPLNELCGAARCMGTGFIVRQRALTAIGGWPLINVGEDFMLSSCLSDAGWETAFISEKVQVGLGPDSMLTHVKQKQRWVDGAIAVHKRFDFYMPWTKTRMTSSQRTIFLLQTLREYTPMVNTIAVLLLPLCSLIASHEPNLIAPSSSATLRSVQRAFLVFHLITRLNSHVMYGHLASSRLSSLKSVDIWMAPYAASRCLLSFLPYFSEQLTFSPSGSITSCLAERDPLRRKGWYHRICNRFILCHLLHAILCATPLLLALGASLRPFGPDHPLEHRASPLLLVLPGPVIRLLHLTRGAFVPVLYMASPPAVPGWVNLTTPDHSGVRRPIESPHKPANTARPFIRQLDWVFLGEITIIAFCGFMTP